MRNHDPVHACRHRSRCRGLFARHGRVANADARRIVGSNGRAPERRRCRQPGPDGDIHARPCTGCPSRTPKGGCRGPRPSRGPQTASCRASPHSGTSSRTGPPATQRSSLLPRSRWPAGRLTRWWPATGRSRNAARPNRSSSTAPRASWVRMPDGAGHGRGPGLPHLALPDRRPRMVQADPRHGAARPGGRPRRGALRDITSFMMAGAPGTRSVQEMARDPSRDLSDRVRSAALPRSLLPRARWRCLPRRSGVPAPDHAPDPRRRQPVPWARPRRS